MFQESDNIGAFSQPMADALLGNIRETYLRLNEKLRGILGPDYSIDEMALLYNSDEALLRDLTAIVRQDGYSFFNAAQDTVNTWPIKSHYHVNYWFASTPFPYRLELMRIKSGFSPLHAGTSLQLGHEYMDLCTWGIHASFKCEDEESYATAQVALRNNDYALAQSCTSTYGRFSYYVSEEDKTPSWYLKPRINLRDAK